MKIPTGVGRANSDCRKRGRGEARTAEGPETNMDAKQFGTFLVRRRKEKGFTQKELAERLGLTDKAISRWENGHGFPDIESLEPLARELGVTLPELLHGEELKQEEISLPAADAMIENALEITLENRRRERKKTLILFVASMLLLLLFSILKSIPVMGILAMGAAVSYAVSGIFLMLRGTGGRGTRIFYGTLLLLVAVGLLCLLLGTSIHFAAS